MRLNLAPRPLETQTPDDKTGDPEKTGFKFFLRKSSKLSTWMLSRKKGRSIGGKFWLRRRRRRCLLLPQTHLRQRIGAHQPCLEAGMELQLKRY